MFEQTPIKFTQFLDVVIFDSTERKEQDFVDLLILMKFCERCRSKADGAAKFVFIFQILISEPIKLESKLVGTLFTSSTKS